MEARIVAGRAGFTSHQSLVTRHASLVIALVAAALLSSCGSARPSKYFQLTVPGNAPAAADPKPLPVTLLIGPLRASHLYREDRIVYSSGGQNMGTYEYQRWAAPPTEMLVDVLLRDLRASGRYRAVDVLRSNSRGDYILYGRLYDFKEVSTPALVARVTVDAELREVKSGATVWTHFYTHDEPVSGKDISAVVAALDRNAQRGMNEVKSELDQFFAIHAAN